MTNHEAIQNINKADVMEKMWDTLNLCDMYHPTDKGMDIIYKEWEKNKGTADVWNGMSVLDILSKHPHYVPEKGYIVKKDEYDRPIDFNTIYNVLDNVRCWATLLRKEVVDTPFSYTETKSIAKRYENICRYFGQFDYPEDVTYKGMTLPEVIAERSRWTEKLAQFHERADIIVEYETTYSKDSYLKADSVKNLFYKLMNWVSRMSTKTKEDGTSCNQLLIDKEVYDCIQSSELGIKGIREGQSFNKVVGKILTQTGMSTIWVDYNKEIARLGDAANPIKYTRFTILSANPVDFWRMSFGSSWSSCHTIDKLGNFSASRGGSHYDGIHGSGTESYMLDTTSLIMYTVDSKYEGNDYELQPKINRCMFHVGEGKFVMGRVYPQGRDGEKDVYKQWRNIFQTIIAECLDIPNYWKTEYDKDVKYGQTESYGTHYRDYNECYCDIAGWSWHKPFADSEPSKKIIKIGHNPICPSCGEWHDTEENIECEDCASDENEYTEHCRYCGSRIQTDEDEYYTDGDGCYWCCEHHANYDSYYRCEDDDDGYMHYEGDVYYEASTDTYWMYGDDGVETSDGNWFHDEATAEYYDYEYYDGEYYPSSDFEEDALTGDRFPYWNDTYSYCSYDAKDGHTYYFVDGYNMNEWIEDNESDDDEDEDNDESEVA